MLNGPVGNEAMIQELKIAVFKSQPLQFHLHLNQIQIVNFQLDESLSDIK